MLQWTLRCMYLFELWFSPDIWPGVELLDHKLALFLVFFSLYSTLKVIVISHSLVFHHPLLLNPVLISVNSPFIILLGSSPLKWILAMSLILEEGALSYCQTWWGTGNSIKSWKPKKTRDLKNQRDEIEDWWITESYEQFLQSLLSSLPAWHLTSVS